MIRAKNSNATLILVTFMITLFLCSCPRLCTSQENNTANACHSYATCGAFGICNSQDSPICSCLKGFGPGNEQQWASGNWTGGCVRKVSLLCRVNIGNRERDGFLKIQRIKVPGYASRWLGPKSDCPGLCLMNCSCIAYAHDSLLGCMFWNSTLLDIEKFPTGFGSDLYFRVANSELDHKKDYKKMIVALVTIGSVLVSICMFFFCKWMAKKRGRRRGTLVGRKSNPTDSASSSLEDELSKLDLEGYPLFKFEVLANATDGFSNANKLGKGGFGVVYKGELSNGREIAVKRLSRASGQGLHEFMNEVVLISKLQHRNLVRLIGCCVGNNEKMLIYEYMPNKSLDFFSI